MADLSNRKFGHRAPGAVAKTRQARPGSITLGKEFFRPGLSHEQIWQRWTATPEQVAGIQSPRLVPYRRMGSRWGDTLDVVPWWVVVIPLAVLPVWTGLKRDWERKRKLRASGFPIVQATAK
jgi:hypothetical protein